jgi:hypothetical protein
MGLHSYELLESFWRTQSSWAEEMHTGKRHLPKAGCCQEHWPPRTCGFKRSMTRHIHIKKCLKYKTRAILQALG